MQEKISEQLQSLQTSLSELLEQNHHLKEFIRENGMEEAFTRYKQEQYASCRTFDHLHDDADQHKNTHVKRKPKSI